MIKSIDTLRDRATAAFSRTTPHPADPRVRLAKNAGDLIAIHCTGVSAVIWQRRLSKNLKRAIAQMAKSPFNDGVSSFPVNYLRRRNHQKINDNISKSRHIPECIRGDMLRLGKIFTKTAGVTPKNMTVEMVNYQNLDDAAKDFDRSLLVLAPHTDGFNLRLGTIYSAEDDLGTEWYNMPVNKLAHVKAQFQKSKKPETLKKKYNVQSTQTGHVMIFKGYMPSNNEAPYPEGEHFVHSMVTPRANAFRLGYFAAMV